MVSWKRCNEHETAFPRDVARNGEWRRKIWKKDANALSSLKCYLRQWVFHCYLVIVSFFKGKISNSQIMSFISFTFWRHFLEWSILTAYFCSSLALRTGNCRDGSTEMPRHSWAISATGEQPGLTGRPQHSGEACRGYVACGSLPRLQVASQLQAWDLARFTAAGRSGSLSRIKQDHCLWYFLSYHRCSIISAGLRQSSGGETLVPGKCFSSSSCVIGRRLFLCCCSSFFCLWALLIPYEQLISIFIWVQIFPFDHFRTSI